MKSFNRFLSEGPFKTIADNVPMATRLRRINKFLADDIGRTYHDGVPIDAIFKKLEENGFQAVQEDGTPWDGIITGRDATYHFDLVDLTADSKPAKVRLNVSHHKMDVSGRYEVTAYVN